MHALATALALAAASAAPAAQTPGFELALDFLGDHPVETNPGFHEDLQGVTHDAGHWFFSQEQHLWKVPVGVDLAGDVASHPGTLVVDTSALSGIGGAGYDHMGDLGYHAVPAAGGGTIGYLAVGLSGAGPPQIAVFRASDLAFVGRTELYESGVDGAVGVSPDGRLWTRRAGDASLFNEYLLNWEDLDVPLGSATLILTFVAQHQLKDAGGTPHPVHFLQGMTFSPSGALMYTSSGFMTEGCFFDDVPFSEDELKAMGGIRAIDVATFTLVAKTSYGSGLFEYTFLPGWPDCEEPEGITWWDLDDGAAPGITGTLHAILLDNDASADEVSLKHYTNRVHVGGGFPGEFATVQGAYAFAWDGSELVLAPGSYAELLTLSKRVLVRGLAGAAVVGD